MVRAPFRKLLLKRMPYALIYRVEGKRVIVYTIAALKQDPDKLMAYLDSLTN